MVLDNNLKRKLEIYIKLNYVASVEEDFLCPDINEEEITKSSSGLFGFVHLKNEFLPGLAPVDGGAQLFQQRDLAALPAL